MDRDRLVVALERYGIRFLEREEVGTGSVSLAPGELIGELAEHPDPRLHIALTALFLLHPSFSRMVGPVGEQLKAPARLELQARYMAAVYLQRIWRTRLGYYIENETPLPDYFSRQLGLPSPETRFGKAGLYALAEWHSRRSPYPYNRLASYTKSLDLLIGQLRAETRRHEFAASG